MILEEYSDEKYNAKKNIELIHDTRKKTKLIQKSIAKWSKYINFQHIGITLYEQMKKDDVMDYLNMVRRNMMDTRLVLLTNGKNYIDAINLIDGMIELAPGKLCIILPDDWEDYVNDIRSLLLQKNYRFFRRGDNPIDGFKFLLFSKKKEFDIELYHHNITNPQHKAIDNEFLIKIGEPNLFRFVTDRKNTMVLCSEKIFKCINAFKLWKYWNTRQLEICSFIQKRGYKFSEIYRTYESIMVEAIVSDPNQLEVIKMFSRYSRICDLCVGCVECIVFPKK